jgi:hypothetical protein
MASDAAQVYVKKCLERLKKRQFIDIFRIFPQFNHSEQKYGSFETWHMTQ